MFEIIVEFCVTVFSLDTTDDVVNLARDRLVGGRRESVVDLLEHVALRLLMESLHWTSR